MEKKDIKRFASYAQIILTNEEVNFYLKTFKNIEESVNKLRKIEFENNVISMDRIINHGIDFEDLGSIFDNSSNIIDKDLNNDLTAVKTFTYKKE